MTTELEHGLCPLQHQIVHRTLVLQFTHLFGTKTGEDGDRHDLDAGLGGQRCLHHRAIAVDRGKADAPVGKLSHRQPHRGRDVIELEVEHHLTALGNDVVDHRPATGKEQLQADLKKSDLPGQPVDQGQGLAGIGQIQSKDNALFQRD